MSRIAKERAEALVTEAINRTDYGEHGPCITMPSMTLTKPYGWVFFYNSRAFLETGNIFLALGGNGPVVVDAVTGEVTMLGSALPPDQEIAKYERRRTPEK